MFWCWCDCGSYAVRIHPYRNSGFGLYGLFLLSQCDESVVACQNVFLRPTTHSKRGEYFLRVPINHIQFMKCVIPSGYILKRGSNPHAFPTFWSRLDIGRISSKRRIYHSNDYLKHRSRNFVNFGQNCVLDPIPDSVNNHNHFAINPFIKTSFQICTITKLSMVVKLLPSILAVISWSSVASLTKTFCCLSLAALPILLSRSKSANWQKILLFVSFFLRVETMFTLTGECHLE